MVNIPAFSIKSQPSPRIIKLDADESSFYISNNGPEIDIREHEIIFEAGYSKKPNGTGLGLYISREVLKKIGYNIKVDPPRLESGVTFRIFKSPDL
jgi:signal transduction histidine kinase